jgi:hypothetical protein
MSDSLAEAFGAMDDADRAKLQARLAERLGTEMDVLAAEAPEPEPVAASGARLQRMAARQSGLPAPSPERASVTTRGRTVLTAAGGLYNVSEGTELSDRRAFATAMAATLQRMDRRSGPARGKVLVASAETIYPENRRLTEDQEYNAWLLDRETSFDALVATGGICLPTNVDYAVSTWATAERPVRDSLAAFQATRGGLRFVQPPDIAEWAAATAVWTEATDLSPGVETKPVVAMTCGSEELVYVEAIPTRIGFGNMQSRFAPEQVAANTDLAIAAAARVAENNLLNLIAEKCVKGVTDGTASLLGAARELLPALDLAIAQQKQVHRLPQSQIFAWIAPAWLRNELRSDLAREAAHQQGKDWNSLALTDDQLDDLLKQRGIRPIWHLDGQTGSVEGGVTQIFVAPTKAAIAKYPAKVVSYLFPEGSMQFLDAGRLDLGVVRDSTLDSTNDYETFVETFESVAYRGYASGALQLVSTLESTGAAALAISTTGKPPQ